MAEASSWPLDAAGHVLLRLARLMLAAGADSEHVHQRVEHLASRLGFAVQLFISSERLLLMIGSDGIYRTRIGKAVGAMGIDAGRLFALGDLARSIAAGGCDAAAAEARLQAIEGKRSVYPGWLVILAVATATASLARLFGAPWPVVGAAFGAGLIDTLLRRLLPGLGLSPVTVAGLAAGLSGTAAALPLYRLGADPSLALVSAGMILVPGVPLINGVRDLAQGHAAIGVARLANGVVIVIAIAAGLAVASMICGMQMPVTMQTRSLTVPLDFAFAGIAAAGFAILFNAPARAVGLIALCGAIAHAARTAVITQGGGIALATLLGACMATQIAMALARRRDAPWAAFAFPAVVAMVPGSYAFRGMIGILDIMRAGASASAPLLGATLAQLATAVVLTTAIGVGLLAAGASGALLDRTMAVSRRAIAAV